MAKQYKAVHPIRHNGKQYSEGDLVPLEKKQNIIQLLDAGAIIELESTSTTDSDNSRTEIPEEGRLAILKLAYAELDATDESNWLKDGITPDLAVLSKAVGWKVSGNERDQLMAEI